MVTLSYIKNKIEQINTIINSIKLNIQKAYTSIENKGISITKAKTSSNLYLVIDEMQLGENINEYYSLPTNSSKTSFCDYINKIPDIDFSTIKSFYNAFLNFSRLSSFKNNTTNNVTNFYRAFDGCSNLFEVEINTSSGTNFNRMFYDCNSLYKIGEMDFGKATNISSLFGGSKQIVIGNIGGFKNLGKSYTQNSESYSAYTLDLSRLNLNRSQAITIFNKLYDLNLSYNVATGGTLYKQKIVLNSNTIGKLTDADKNIAINKGWIVS